MLASTPHTGWGQEGLRAATWRFEDGTHVGGFPGCHTLLDQPRSQQEGCHPSNLPLGSFITPLHGEFTDKKLQEHLLQIAFWLKGSSRRTAALQASWLATL